jgi:hypothetical protein
MTHTADIPSLEQLAVHRHDQECFEVAAAIEQEFGLHADAGYYVHPERGVSDHGWNVAADGTIVDMTAAQHDYTSSDDEPDCEDQPLLPPEHPEIIAPGTEHHRRYISWTGDEPLAQTTAHQLGHEHGGPGVCPLCAAGPDTVTV